MAAGSGQHVVERMVTGSSGHRGREAAGGQGRRLALPKAPRPYQAANPDPQLPRLLFPLRERGGAERRRPIGERDGARGRWRRGPGARRGGARRSQLARSRAHAAALSSRLRRLAEGEAAGKSHGPRSAHSV